jgi:uncharacterized protein (DUF433 family)
MVPVIHIDPVPLRVEEDGTIRIGTTRVTLDVLLQSFKNGNAAETIVHKFPTLQLADVYAVIAYYLRHKYDLEAYLQWRGKQAEELRQKIEANQTPLPDLKARWQVRQTELEQSHAQPGR